MRDTEIKEIDGHHYVCTMMPIRSAHQTFIELCTTLGRPVINAIARASEEEKADLKALFIAAVSVAMQNLDDHDRTDRLIANVFDGISCQGVGELNPWDTVFNIHFRGRLFSMYKVWAWSVQINYKDFLDAAQSLGLSEAVKLGKDALSSHLQTLNDESGMSSSASS